MRYAAAALSFAACCAALPDPASTPLNEWPMIFAHDAATTYLEPGIVDPIDTWSKTQPSGGMAKLLDCGSRALDWRPKAMGPSAEQLIGHHDGTNVPYSMGAAVDELVRWAGIGARSVEDLIVLGISRCNNGDQPAGTCIEQVTSLLAARNITTFIRAGDCGRLRGLTVSEAHRIGSLPNGGSIVAVHDSCWDSHWDPTVSCSGFGSVAEEKSFDNFMESEVHSWFGRRDRSLQSPYSCYKDSDSKSFPLNRMWKYLDRVTANGPPADGRLYIHQALWQQTAASTTEGELEDSSLLLDESRSGLNALVAARIRSGKLDVSRMNLLGLNNVCDSGPDVLAALRKRV